MTWLIEYTKDAIKSLSKLDAPTRNRIREFINVTLPAMDNPRQKGSVLHGDLSLYWRYKVGDYRIICEIIDSEITVLVIEIGHRSHIYKSH